MWLYKDLGRVSVALRFGLALRDNSSVCRQLQRRAHERCAAVVRASAVCQLWPASGYCNKMSVNIKNYRQFGGLPKGGQFLGSWRMPNLRRERTFAANNFSE